MGTSTADQIIESDNHHSTDMQLDPCINELPSSPDMIAVNSISNIQDISRLKSVDDLIIGEVHKPTTLDSHSDAEADPCSEAQDRTAIDQLADLIEAAYIDSRATEDPAAADLITHATIDAANVEIDERASTSRPDSHLSQGPRPKRAQPTSPRLTRLRAAHISNSFDPLSQ